MYAIPPTSKPINLYLWPQCGYCVKQHNVIQTLDPSLSAWFMANVAVNTIKNPKAVQSIPSYPYWTVRGSPYPGLKQVSDILMLKSILES